MRCRPLDAFAYRWCGGKVTAKVSNGHPLTLPSPSGRGFPAPFLQRFDVAQSSTASPFFGSSAFTSDPLRPATKASAFWSMIGNEP